jgi:hypothetical protein
MDSDQRVASASTGKPEKRRKPVNIPGKAIAIASVGLAMGFSSASFAACTAAQVSGTWEVAFSDGNSCRLKLNNNGSINAGKSVCYDPTRGTAVPDSGNLKVQGNCFAEGEIVLGGARVELPVQFSNDRTTAAGRYLAPDMSKGSVVLIRVP